MNTDAIIETLGRRYPGKTVIKNSEEATTEILCEIEPAADHPAYSVAISVIDRTIPHSHKITTETYEVLTGTLTVYVDGVPHTMKEKQTLTILPGQVHWARGSETWIKVTSTPGWTVRDYIPHR